MGKEAAEAVKDAVHPTAVRAEGAGVGVQQDTSEERNKTGISAEKRINIKVSPYSSKRGGLLVIKGTLAVPPTDVSTTTKMEPETI